MSTNTTNHNGGLEPNEHAALGRALRKWEPVRPRRRTLTDDEHRANVDRHVLLKCNWWRRGEGTKANGKPWAESPALVLCTRTVAED